MVVAKPGRLVTELCLPLANVRNKKASSDQANTRDTNDVCVVQRCEQDVTPGTCQVKLNVPEAWEGFYVVRCFLECESECAIGSKTVRASKQ